MEKTDFFARLNPGNDLVDLDRIVEKSSAICGDKRCGRNEDNRGSRRQILAQYRSPKN